MRTPEEVARLFHDIYELLAPSFGYETRKDTRDFDPTTPNGRLMVAVADRVAAEIRRDTIEKAKDVVRAYADCYQPTEKMLADIDALLQEEETK